MAVEELPPISKRTDRQIIEGFMAVTINVQSAHNFARGANCG
jgi:hypothetical protein